MSLAQLQYFVAVAETGYVRRAARDLGIAQPAVSRQILHLEYELATPLFVRTSRGMRLSRSGEVLLRHARTILSDVRAAESAVRDAKHNDLAALNLAQLQSFVAVAEAGTVGRAAQVLRLAQPAVSRQIQKLELGLGALLFVRSARGMRLSTRGEAFLAHAHSIVGEMHAAHSAVRAAADGHSGASDPSMS